MQDSRPVEHATPLSGIRVLDLSIWRPGPYATSLLVALGADVLKVEPPGGDPMRHYEGLFDVINAGKRSVELDLKDDDDRSRALELAGVADVIVEGFRPGVMARLGLDYATVRRLNPAIVYCSISGFGRGAGADSLSVLGGLRFRAGVRPPAGDVRPSEPGFDRGEVRLGHRAQGEHGVD